MPQPEPIKFERVTYVAYARLDEDMGFFFSEKPNWTKRKLLKIAGMDPRLLERYAMGETFNTRAADKLQATMEAILRGEIDDDGKPAPSTQASTKRNGK